MTSLKNADHPSFLDNRFREQQDILFYFLYHTVVK